MANEVEVKITVEERQALKALSKLTKNVDLLGDKAKETSSKIDSAGKVFIGAFGAGVALRGLNALQNKMGEVIDEAIQFDKAIREINTLLPKNEKLTGKLTNEIKNLASQYATTNASQAKAYYQIISAGTAKGAKAVELLGQANQLALGGLSDVGSSINILTDIINVYGAENITAEEAADSLFQTVKLGKTTISELTSSIGLVIPSAQKLNVSLDDVGAALATMTTQGLSTSQRVTQLSSLFSALFKKGGEAAKFGPQIAKAFSLKNLREKGLAKFLEELNTATKGNEETLQKLLGRTEAVRAVFALTGKQAETLGRNMEGFGNKTGAAAEAAKEMQASLDFQTDLAEKNLKALVDIFVTKLAPALTTTLQLFNSLFRDTETGNAAQEIEKIQKRINSVDLALREIDKRGGVAQALFGDGSDLRKQRAELITQRDVLKSIQDLRKEEDRKLKGGVGVSTDPTSKSGDDGSSGGGGLSPEQQARINAEKQTQLEIQLIKDEAKLANEEIKLLEGEAQGLATEGDLERLREIELEKISIKADAEFQKNDLLKTQRERDIADEKTHEKLKLDLIKKSGAQTIAVEKKIAANREAVRKGNIQAAQNFLQVGEALSKEGSAAAKSFAITNASISTYLAATSALAPPPLGLGPVAGIPLAASTVALGLLNIAKIAGFAQGGVIGGFQGASIGNDNQLAKVRTGEMVLAGPEQKTLFDEIKSGNLGSGNRSSEIEAMLAQPIIIQVDNKEIARATREAIKDGFQVAV